MLFLICLVVDIKVLRLQYFCYIITTYKGVMDLSFTYKPLWKLLIDKDMTKTELRKKTQIAPSTFTKMNNDQQVSLDILARICVELKCGFDDIVEIER